ncbi:MAG TPA: serine hydrolase domain-containing protein, partial [Actinomycetes bacterium]|nr:serine hydrolase domain-containing protein [Actinomycetes bacterium]
SMTKSFTAATVLLLRDAGLLTLDDKVAQHLPELRTGTRGSQRITLRQLLTMTGGYPTDDPWGDRQQGASDAAFGDLLATPLEPMWRPGTRFEYSNLGYALLGRVVAAVTKQQFREVVHELVLDPLGLTSSGFVAEDLSGKEVATGYVRRLDNWVVEPLAGYGAFAPMGGLFSSTRDIASWVVAMLDAAKTPERSALSGALHEMQQGQRLIESVVEPRVDGLPVAPTVRSYGFGLFEELAPWGRTVAHSGGYPGFGSHMRWHPASGLGIVAMGNRTYAPMGKVATQALQALVETRSQASVPRSEHTRLEPARAVVEELLNRWDDALVDEWFADNVGLDEPWPIRQAQAEDLVRVHGRLRRDPASKVRSPTPAHTLWWLVGAEGGRVKVEVLLSPHPTPLIQALSWTSVPQASPSIAAAALQALRAREPLGVLGEPTAGDGVASATFAASGPSGRFEVEVAKSGHAVVRRPVIRTEPTP